MSEARPFDLGCTWSLERLVVPLATLVLDRLRDQPTCGPAQLALPVLTNLLHLFPFRRRLTVKHSHADFTTDALARASTEELLLEMRRRIIRPRDRRRETDHWDGIGSRGELLRRL